MEWQPIADFVDDGNERDFDLWVITKPIKLNGKEIAPMEMRLTDCLVYDGVWQFQPYPSDEGEPVLNHMAKITHFLLPTPPQRTP